MCTPPIRWRQIIFLYRMKDNFRAPSLCLEPGDQSCISACIESNEKCKPRVQIGKPKACRSPAAGLCKCDLPCKRAADTVTRGCHQETDKCAAARQRALSTRLDEWRCMPHKCAARQTFWQHRNDAFDRHACSGHPSRAEGLLSF